LRTWHGDPRRGYSAFGWRLGSQRRNCDRVEFERQIATSALCSAAQIAIPLGGIRVAPRYLNALESVQLGLAPEVRVPGRAMCSSAGHAREFNRLRGARRLIHCAGKGRAITVRSVARRQIPTDASHRGRMPNLPSVRTRFLVALAIGLASGAFTYLLQSRHPEILAYDWTFHWRAGRAVWGRLNPYLVVVPTGPYPYSYYWFYPLPSVFLALPTAWLPAVWSSAITVAACGGILAFAVTRENYARLPLFLSSQFMMGAAAGSSPMMLVTAACAWPAMQWAISVKPNLGLAAFISRPTWIAVYGSVAMCALAFLVEPTWPWFWLRQIFAMKGGDSHTVLGHIVPIMVPGGQLVVLALLRWRRPDARLLFAMACVPQSMTFHDVLPLMLIPKTFRQSLIMGLLSFVAFFLALPILRNEPDMATMFHETAPFAVWFMYVPALVLVLLRPNEASVPTWIERLTLGWPHWLRGGVPDTPAKAD
jgi:hypothetical protein